MSDRRTFLVQMGALTATVSMSASASVGLEVVDCRRAVVVSPVVGFMLDQPYLDLTGLATPYVPPAGLRSAEPVANTFAAAFHQGIGFPQDQS